MQIKTYLCCLLFFLPCSALAKEKLPYQNSRLSTDERVEDLLSRMTWAEKLGQLRCTLGWNYYELDGKNVSVSESFKKDMEGGGIGLVWATYRADPWTQKSLANGLTPRLAAKAGNAMQRYAREHTRLGIPLLLCEEAPHGHMAIGTTVFPTGLGMAATWSPELMQEVGAVVANEIRLQGAHVSYGPVIDLAREPRWSRVEETFGEDPVLSGTLAAAMVRGTGGGQIEHPRHTIATLKHFVGYGTTEGGQNGGPTMLGQRELKEQFLPPFKQAIDAGALSVMTSYNSVDGIPCTADGRLLNDLLRSEWGFRGFVVSDLYSVDGLRGTHRVAESLSQAAEMALTAGLDVDLGAQAFLSLSSKNPDSIDKKVVDAVDESVRRVLRMKFDMGLFDQPYVDENAASAVRSPQNQDVALRVARASVTLLKNENNVLPLRKDMRVAVVGPNADNLYNMLGDYTAPQDEACVTTLLDGIAKKIDQNHIFYAKGCAIRDTNNCDIPAAVEAARRADVVVVAVGGSSARDFKTSYQQTGAAKTTAQSISDMDCGEGFDRATLDLLGRQQELLDALKATGKPLVVVYIEGRPLLKNWAADHADALLTAYYPGEKGGEAIADVLFGDYNPAGRLPISVPRAVGQLPVYYNKKSPRPHDYVEMSAAPRYAFGYGLSYSTFEYSDLQATADSVSVVVRNMSDRDGEEVVQLYMRDEVASVAQPLLQLKHFARVPIAAGASRRVVFPLTRDDFTLVNAQLERVVEPGRFHILVGAASNDIRLKGIVEIPSPAEK